MMNEILPMDQSMALVPSYSYEAVPMAVSQERTKSGKPTGNYLVGAPGYNEAKLVRDVDFGMIRKKDGSPMAKHPTLYKSGAEKVAVSYGLCQNYELVSKIENPEIGFFYFLVRCDLVKIVNGERYVMTSAYGSGNTREGRTGSQSPYDGANSAVKMAQKRALVSAALSLGCLSDAFTQDLESAADEGNPYVTEKDPTKPISAAQVKFFYSAAARHGLTKAEAKALLSSKGYASAKDIKSGDFDAILAAMENTEVQGE